MNKIICFVPSLKIGGSERFTVNLVNYLSKKNLEVTLVALNKRGKYINAISNSVNFIGLDHKRIRYSIFSIIKIIRTMHPEIIFSTGNHLNRLMCFLKISFPKKSKLVIRESSIVSQSKGNRNKNFNLLNSFLSMRMYNKADKIVSQSVYMKNDLIIEHKINENKIIVIRNPVDLNNINKKVQKYNPFEGKEYGPNIIAIGRLEDVKNFDRIIKSMPKLLSRKPNAKLWILGRGSKKNHLLSLINKLELQNSVELCGFVENPYAWLNNADLFVLSSKYEGLPNVLLEAIACGCPVISTKHPGGTKEIFDKLDINNRYVDKLTWENHWFLPLPDNISKDFKNQFNLKFIGDKYLTLFKEVYNN
jgi:glycosyltransferase involved in cell wall biosynthesis